MTAPIGAMEIIHHSVRAARIGEVSSPIWKNEWHRDRSKALTRSRAADLAQGAAVRSSTAVKTGGSVRSLNVK